MAQDPILLWRKYIQNPPEGFIADDIRNMPYHELLDMDNFLNEDDTFGFDDDDSENGLSSDLHRSPFAPFFAGASQFPIMSKKEASCIIVGSHGFLAA